MSFHLCFFSGAKTDSTANQNVPAVTDQGLNTSSNARYFAPDNVSVFAAQAINDTISRARINAPSLRNEGLPEIFPLTVAAAQATEPLVCEWGDEGPRLRRDEEFGVEASNGASTVDLAHALLWIRSMRKPVPPGKRMTIVATSTQTLIASAYTLGGLTFDQTLPVGTYAVIGMAAVCNDAACARLVFPRSGTLRPGCPTSPTVGRLDARQIFRSGRQGEWGRFTHVTPPQLEIGGIVAGAETATVILDLVQVEGSGMAA